MDSLEILDWVMRGGLTAGLLLAVWGFVSGRVPTRLVVDEVRRARDKAEHQIDRLVSLVERQTEAMETQMRATEELRRLLSAQVIEIVRLRSRMDYPDKHEDD